MRKAITLVAVLFCLTVSAAERQKVTAPNYRQAAQYNTQYLRQFVYDTAVTPNWVGKSDQFWYAFRTSGGTNYYRVNPKLGTKEPLFDRVKLSSLLSEMVRKPLDPAQLPLSRVSINDEGTKLKFVVDESQYEYDLMLEKLAKLGRAPTTQRTFGARGGFQRRNQEEQRREQDQEQRRDDQQDEQQQRREQDNQQQEQQQQDQQNQQQNQQQQEQQQRGEQQRPTTFGGRGADHRNFSPDRKSYVFAKGHNLYYVEMKEELKKEEAKEGEKKAEPKKDGEVEQKPAETPVVGQGQASNQVPIPRVDPKLDDTAIQLSTDGVEDYSFAGFGGGFGARRGGGSTTQPTTISPDRKTRPNVTWSPDSRSFYVSRGDSRNVQELWVINSLAEPRPTLEKYKYPMPGEENVRKTELHIFNRDLKKLSRIQPKWKDEGYSNIHWDKNGQELRFLRRDRLVRNIEFCSRYVATGETRCLIGEGIENANVLPQAVRYLEESDEMVWWSERTGWGHFYLYDRFGKLKNAITSGQFRASRIVDVDTKKRLLYFVGNAREDGESPYFEHLYSVHLDGTGLTLLDPGNANHRSTLSPSKQYLVDNCSRVDMQPVARLRDASGKTIIELEKADLSRLKEVGWKMPETFTVKAADGVTDLYGNMWKPFDFDPDKRYPIIAHVYPGPQMEGTIHAFTPTSGEQQLAQLGFIVIQVGHRGGAPTRSKAYASFGYFNLRDYGLPDKKAAIEQLAARYRFIDIDRVGIYGHSGGGFMTAAAMLQKPYNEFFKVGVSTSGNHDNNVYNSGWSERYHGLREVAVTDQTQNTGSRTTRGAGQRGSGERDQTSQGAFQVDESDYFFETQALDEEQWTLPDEVAEAAAATEQKADAKTEEQKKEAEKKMKFEIHVPTNAELAANLKGHLLLVHGELDNNVHPANTLRLVDALVKANKRFDMLYLPGKRHGYADYSAYMAQRMHEYFAQHLLGDYQPGADLAEKVEPKEPAR